MRDSSVEQPESSMGARSQTSRAHAASEARHVLGGIVFNPLEEEVTCEARCTVGEIPKGAGAPPQVWIVDAPDTRGRVRRTIRGRLERSTRRDQHDP